MIVPLVCIVYFYMRFLNVHSLSMSHVLYLSGTLHLRYSIKVRHRTIFFSFPVYRGHMLQLRYSIKIRHRTILFTLRLRYPIKVRHRTIIFISGTLARYVTVQFSLSQVL